MPRRCVKSASVIWRQWLMSSVWIPRRCTKSVLTKSFLGPYLLSEMLAARARGKLARQAPRLRTISVSVSFQGTVATAAWSSEHTRRSTRASRVEKKVRKPSPAPCAPASSESSVLRVVVSARCAARGTVIGVASAGC